MLNFFIPQSSWWLVRFSAMLIVPSIIFDFEVVFLIQSFLIVHAKLGLESVVNDYIHNITLKLLYLVLLRIIILEVFLYFIEFTL